AHRGAGARGSPGTSALGGFGQLGPTPREQVEDRHSHGNAVGHLIENHAERTVGDVGIDLHAAIHRPRMQDEDVPRRALQSFARHSKDAVVLPKRRDITALHALELQAKDVQRVRPLDGVVDAIEHLDLELVDGVRQQRARTTDGDMSAKLLESPDVRARDARVQHVTDDAHFDALDPLEVIAEGQEVEQTLGGMFMSPVTRVDHVRFDASKNRLTIVAPRSVGTFLIARSLISLNGSAVSRMSLICSLVSGSRPSKSLPSGLAATPLTRCPRAR